MRTIHITLFHRWDDVRICHKECLTLAREGYDVHYLTPRADEVENAKNEVS